MAHAFGMSPIQAGSGGPLIQPVLNWGTGRRHLGLRPDPPGIYLNLPRMQTDFEAMLNRRRAELRASSRLRGLPDSWTRRRVTPAQPDAIAGWRQFLAGN